MITLTDLFCGCGGSSSGAFAVPGVHVQYAMNHWPLAIESHNTNHPDTHHDCADISQTHPARYARTTGLIGSPECTNHSLAKGRKRKNLNQQDIFQAKEFDPSAVRSRATMWDIVAFTEVHRYEFVIVENVVDVRYWEMFEVWLKAMWALGYHHECVYLNAMFAHDLTGRSFAPQSRDRIYVVFWKKGNPKPDLEIRPKAPCPKCGTVEAVQTWKPNRRAGKYKTQYTYRCAVCATPVVPFYFAAINALDLSLPMVRIGDKKKPLSPNTRKRIQYGLDKFGYVPALLDQRNSDGTPQSRIRQTTDPLNAQSTGFSSYLFSPFLFQSSFTYSDADRTRGLADVLPTQTTQTDLNLIAPQPYLLANRDSSPPRAMNEVIHTQTTANQEMLIVPPGSFLFTQESSNKGQAVTDPLSTITTLRNTMGFVTPIHGNARPHEFTDALNTETTSSHGSLILTPYHGTAQASTAYDPTPTMPTRDSVALIDAQPLIDDCYFRMLQPSETKRAQGFAADYVILGTKEDQQKQIGNANPPPTMELLVRRCVESLL